MRSAHITDSSRSEAWLIGVMSRERAPSKWLQWVISGETRDRGFVEAHWRGESHSGMIRIALRLVSSEIQSRFKLVSGHDSGRNLLILSIKLKLQN